MCREASVCSGHAIESTVNDVKVVPSFSPPSAGAKAASDAAGFKLLSNNAHQCGLKRARPSAVQCFRARDEASLAKGKNSVTRRSCHCGEYKQLGLPNLHEPHLLMLVMEKQITLLYPDNEQLAHRDEHWRQLCRMFLTCSRSSSSTAVTRGTS